MSTKARATLAGFSAILMWSLLALLTAMTGSVPPFLLAALAFLIGTLVGTVYCALNWRRAAFRTVPASAWIVGTCGLFGYHFFYFTALRNAPAVEASLIAYLWPLLIVFGSGLLPGENLRWHHVGGVLIGLAGAALIVTKGQGFHFESRYGYGYLMAGLCALTWSSYSLVSRRFQSVRTEAVTIFCLVACLLSIACHLLLETTVWPQGLWEWAAVAGLGLMPVGAAFYLWDYGMKKGDIQTIGAASYGAPLFSTVLLIAAGLAEAGPAILLACLLISAGAILAARDMLFPRDEIGRRKLE